MTLSPKGRSDLNRDHLLTLNDGEGMPLSDGMALDTRINYAIIRDDSTRSQPFRITTRRYQHALIARDRREVLSAHWHPSGSSPFRQPHWHIGSAALTDNGVITPRAHIPSGRVSIETLVRLIIEQLGIAPHRDGWREVLDRSEATFTEHRTWQ